MSQIETIMLIILGFAVALLLTLMLGKLLWGQAVGLGKRRSRRDDPVTIATLQADKDKLRAEAAMLSRKLELRLNDLKTRLAEQSAEVSRNRNRIDYLVGEIGERNALVAKRDTEIESLKTQMVPLEEELVSRTQKGQQLKQQLHDKDEELLSQTILINDLQHQLNTSLAENIIATQAPSPTPPAPQPAPAKQVSEVATVDLTAADLSAKDRLQSRISDLTALSQQIEDQRLQLTRQHSQLKNLSQEISSDKPSAKESASQKPDTFDLLDSSSTKLEQQLTMAEHETDELQKELARLDEDWNEKLKQLEDVKSTSAKAPKAKEKPAKSKKLASKKTANKDDETSNVVTLASRIRSLQSDIKGQKK